jgi:hypothetical protein
MSSSTTTISSIERVKIGVRVGGRRMSASGGATVRYPTKSPVKIVSPLDMYAKQQLEDAKSRKAAWDAAKPERDAAEKARRAREEVERNVAAMKAMKRESDKEKRRLENEARLEKLHIAYAKQQADEVSYPLTVGGCAKFVRPDERCFFREHPVPRHTGSITCFTCKREKQPALRHDPLNPIGEAFPCFMCSKPVGWVYYCPDCSYRSR